MQNREFGPSVVLVLIGQFLLSEFQGDGFMNDIV